MILTTKQNSTVLNAFIPQVDAVLHYSNTNNSIEHSGFTDQMVLTGIKTIEEMKPLECTIYLVNGSINIAATLQPTLGKRVNLKRTLKPLHDNGYRLVAYRIYSKENFVMLRFSNKNILKS